jgi:UDP-N-acetylmuramate--alanine ligase
MFKKIKNIHLVGIGGSGMSGIAEVLLNLGYSISGSDVARTEVTKHLSKLGAKIRYSHNAANVRGADVVVVSTAISRTNPEVVFAFKNKIPVIPRAEMLAELARLKYTVTVAGTHGKTTTTSMTAMVLREGGLDPTVIIGGRLKNIGTGAKLGKGNFMVAEADESDGSFLKLQPTVAIITNIDDDHLDHYGTMDRLKAAFAAHVNKVPFYGCSILCADDPGVRSIIGSIERKFYTYGLLRGAGRTDFFGRITYRCAGRTSFDIIRGAKKIGPINLKVPGMHNVSNALAAACCGIILDVPFAKIAKALEEFEGVGRRLEVRGRAAFGPGEIVVVDDYGHHPTEIKTTVKALREWCPDRRIVVIFQPHRYTRTKLLYGKFARAFDDVDVLKIMDIYPAGEKPVRGVSSDLIINEIRKRGRVVSKFDPAEFMNEIRPGDVILTLGAGDVWRVGKEILWRLKR